MAHAKLSPSSAHRWFYCANSVPMATTVPEEETSSVYADEGNVAHHGADVCLANGINAEILLGRQFEQNHKFWEFDQEMVDNVQQYLDYVRGIGGQIFPEYKLPIHTLTGEEGAKGTSDAVVVKNNQLWICDLKYGRGERIDAIGNKQLLIYGLAALRELEFSADIDEIHLVIIQPRISHISEYTLSREQLEHFAEDLAIATHSVAEAERFFKGTGSFDPSFFNPGEKQCRWCRAKASCPAIAQEVLDMFDAYSTVEPVSATVLSGLYAKVPMIRDWANSIEARVQQELTVGTDVPGYKLVEGRRAPRKWADEDTAARIMSSVLGREDIYDQSLISPTTAEKRLKKTAVWSELQTVITQADGKPVVAANDDPRPAIHDLAFQDLTKA